MTGLLTALHLECATGAPDPERAEWLIDRLIAAKRARGCTEPEIAAWVLELADVAREWIANARATAPVYTAPRRGIPS